MLRILILTLVTSVYAVCPALAGDWMFQQGDYTHDPYSGQRVAQYEPIPPSYYRYVNDYAVSGYRYTDSTIRVGSSVDRTHFTETWGGGGLAFASAWLWRGFNEDFVYPSDIDRDRGFGRGDRRFDNRRPGGRGPRGRDGRGYGFQDRGFQSGGYYGDSGIVSFDKDGATIGWDRYGGGYRAGHSISNVRPPYRRGAGPRRP